MASPQYKLSYFDLKGIAEPIRFILKYAGIEFEDERFSFEQWPETKKKMPFGQAPTLTVKSNGRVYTQSLAIMRFFAKKAKLTGNDAFEDMEIDSVVDTLNDFKTKMATYYWESDAALKEKRKKELYAETVPFYLTRLEEIARQNQGHLACKRLTYADIYWTALLDYFYHVNDNKNLIEKYPNLELVAKKVRDLPAIKKWIAERPVTNL